MGDETNATRCKYEQKYYKNGTNASGTDRSVYI